DWAQVISYLVRAPRRLQALSAGARRHASAFGWSATVDRLAKVYTGAMDEADVSRAARVRALAADGAAEPPCRRPSRRGPRRSGPELRAPAPGRLPRPPRRRA